MEIKKNCVKWDHVNGHCIKSLCKWEEYLPCIKTHIKKIRRKSRDGNIVFLSVSLCIAFWILKA